MIGKVIDSGSIWMILLSIKWFLALLATNTVEFKIKMMIFLIINMKLKTLIKHWLLSLRLWELMLL